MAEKSASQSGFEGVRNEDCIAGMKQLPDAIVDLAFADPPFNIGYDYDVYRDKLESDNYLAWSRDRRAIIAEVHPSLENVILFQVDDTSGRSHWGLSVGVIHSCRSASIGSISAARRAG